ncbi:MAG: hypothetical protein F6K41_43800 [Symploca sp. SIO3E6]|nr:hypothetical protein [Caldora sp. SIO3E6]
MASSLLLGRIYSSRRVALKEAGGRRQEAGGRRQEAEGRRQEAGGRRQEVQREVDLR